MSVDSKGRELFIADNSVSGWTGLRYLEEWSGIAKAFDIATGYFDIGALLTLDGKWQGLDKIRILMGAETTHRTRRAILEAVRSQALDRLDESIEEDKQPNPFLRGVPAILDALRSGQIECRVYDKDKFHASGCPGAGGLQQLHAVGEPSRRTGAVGTTREVRRVRMRERRIGIQELHANLGRCLDEVRRGTTLLLTDGEHRVARVARLIPEPAAGASRGGLPIAWSGRRLKKTKPRARLRGGGSMADIVRENRR